MTPDPGYLIDRLQLSLPLIGLYDAPDADVFRPLVEPPAGAWACIFMYYERWLQGETLRLTPERHGCGGAGSYLLGLERGSEEEQLAFFVDEQGMKAAHELMAGASPEIYRPRHGQLFLGPLRPEQRRHLRSVTFLVNPDQLAALVWGAHYHHRAEEGPIVTAPFASGCGLLAAMLGDPARPGAVIGATDLAMRRYLPPSLLAFTTTVPLYDELCGLDERSFLGRGWMEDLRRARGRGLGHVEVG